MIEASYQKNVNSILLGKINLFCCMYICAWTILPIFRSFANQGYFRFLYLLIAGIWFLTSILINRKWFYELLGVSIFGSIYIEVMALYYFFGYGDMMITRLISPIILILYTYMGYFYFSNARIKILKIILEFTAICFLVTAITTSYNLINDINLSRLLTSSSTSQDLVLYFERKNVASYDFIYGTIILVPVLFLALRYSLLVTKKIKITLFMILLVAFAIIVVALANFTTAYFLLIVALILSFFITTKNVYLVFFIMATICLILSPVFIDLIIHILTLVQDAIPSIMTKTKLKGIIDILNGHNLGLNSVSIRTTLFINSVKSFLSSPLIGVGGYYHNSNIIGSHSQFIDDLGRYGIIGSIPIFTFMFYILRKVKRRLIKTKNSFLFSSLLFFILGFLNPVQSYGIMFSVFFILPMICRFLEKITIVDNEKKRSCLTNENCICNRFTS